jgi:hypothetical protein
MLAVLSTSSWTRPSLYTYGWQASGSTVSRVLPASEAHDYRISKRVFESVHTAVGLYTLSSLTLVAVCPGDLRGN